MMKVPIIRQGECDARFFGELSDSLFDIGIDIEDSFKIIAFWPVDGCVWAD